MTLYGRRISVTVAGQTITEPRINFTVERQADRTQTTGQVSIYNLSPGREQQIYQRASDITIEAGYPDTIAAVFQGEVQRVRRPRQNLARITVMELGDNVRSPRRVGGITNRTYLGPNFIRRIITDIVDDMGESIVLTLAEQTSPHAIGGISRFDLGPLDAIPEDATMTDFAFAGPSAEALSIACKRVAAYWYEDDGVIRFRRLNEAQPDAPTINVSPQQPAWWARR